MRVLSLFDGIACWYEALVRAWIKVDAYYASEIDKYAIQIAQKNHPDIIQLGDVKNIEGGGRLSNIDLLIWWSPCQWFSIAGKMLNFDDPRSKLFFEFVRILKEVKPKYFLLENVKMKKEWQDIISQQLWVEPIEINSSLVSAQSRRRLYRTNIPNVTQPQDKGILLKDILQENVDEKYNCSDKQIEIALWGKHQQDNIQTVDGKARTLVAWTHGNAAHYTKTLIDVVGWEVRIKQATKQWYIVAEEWDGISLSSDHSSSSRSWIGVWKANTLVCWWDSYVYEPKMAYNPHTRDYKVNWWKSWKSFTISAMDYAHPKVVMIPNVVRVRKYEVDIEWLKEELRSHKTISNKEIAERLDVPKTTVDHRFRIDSCFAIPDAEIRFRLKELLGITTDRFDKSITEFEERPWVYEKAERKIPVEWKMTTLTTGSNDEIINWPIIRKLTPIECERLQTLPDNYTAWVSDTQRYKALWNGRTVDVIAHIFSFMESHSH